MKIALAAGAEAARLLNDAQFRAEWDDLYSRCPWGTVFQTAAFLDPWFEIYGSRCHPVVVTASRSEGMLDGLILLVWSADSRELAHAGTHHAEYQVWLSAPEDGNAFIEAALDALALQFPRASLRMLYLPPGAPLAWAAAGERWGRSVERVALPVPLLSLDDAAAVEALRRKRFRKCGSKLDEIERKGGLELERIQDPERFAAVFDEIIEYCDLRQGAAHATLPFGRDPCKKLFYLAMARVPELLDISTLRAGGRLASAAICVRNRGRLALALITHSPFLAASSVGSLHIPILAAKTAAERSATHLDLTPGGTYKDRFANAYEEASILTVRLDQRQAARYRRKQRAAQVVRSALNHAGLWDRSKALVFALRSPGRSLARLRAWLWSSSVVLLYVLDAVRLAPAAPSESLHRDSLSDLLKRLPASPQEFLRQAVVRLERSGHVYTRADQECHIWTAPAGAKVRIDEAGVEILLPPGAAAVYDCAAASPALYEEMLRQAMQRDFAGAAGIQRIYTWTRPGEIGRRKILESLGFVPAGAARKLTRAGRVAVEVPRLQ